MRQILIGAQQAWVNALKSQIEKALLRIDELSPQEADTVLSLLPGAEYRFISAGDLAITDKGDLMTVLGYSEDWIEWNSIKSQLDKDQSEFEEKTLRKHALTPELVNEKQKVIGLFYDPE